MLSYLIIHQYTVAEHIELEIPTGMTAITGETGAGKSLLFDALAMCLGERADTNAIRHDCQAFEISAQFVIDSLPAVQAWLNDHDVSADNECIIRRVVKQDGRSLSTINGRSVPLKLTRQLAEQLVTIHGQHEHQLLLKRDTHRHIIDAYGEHHELVNQVKQAYEQWHAIWQRIAALVAQDSEQTRIDFIRFQLQELNELQLANGELEKLEQEHKQLTHAEALLGNCQQSIEQLNEHPQHAITSQLQTVIHLLDGMQTLSPHLKNAHELLTTSLIQSEEALQELQQCLNAFKPEPQRLQQLEQHLQKIYDIARKHRIKAQEIPQQQHKLENELAQLIGRDEQLAQLQQQLDDEGQAYFAAARMLTTQRKRIAKKLSQQITQGIRQLGMPHASFSVDVSPLVKEQPQAQGMEIIEFYVVTNPGATPQPLKKVASGGELSRISLAIQVIAAQAVAAPTLLFDEVDVGIGGATAQTVGELLRQLGQQHQVICVTHQPQVASQSDQHLRVDKQTTAKNTTSTVTLLDKKQRIEEIARMLAGHSINKKTLAHAKDLLAVSD